MKNILIFLFICFGFALNSQITITCYECKKNTTVDCKGCNIQSNLFTGIVIKEKGKPDIPLYEPYKVSNKSSVFTFEDAFGTKTIVNVTSVLSYNTPKKLYDYLSNCLCKPSTIDTDTDRYSVLIQDSILVTYDINGVEIDRDTIRLFDIDTDTKTFLVQDSILVYYDIQNNEIGRDTIKIPFVDTDIQTYLTQDSILVYYDESNTEIDRDTIDIPNITEQGNFRISNDTLYHNNSIDGIEQFVKLPTLDTTTQSYLPILNGLDTIGYENITYLGGVEVDRDTIGLPKETLTNITNTIAGHKIADYTNENGTIQPINETITNLYSVSGGSGAPDTLKYTNETGVTTNVSPIIYGARHDLRLTSPIIERGSDDSTNPKGAGFLHDSYSHLSGFSDNWIGAIGSNRPVLSLKANGNVIFNDVTGLNETNSLYWDNSKGCLAWGVRTTNSILKNYSLTGGRYTTNSGLYSVVAGGNFNQLTGDLSFIGGGENNKCYGGISVVVGGDRNEASSGFSYQTIVGGVLNKTSANYTFIGGGGLNNNNGYQSVITGGYGNTISTGCSESIINGGVGNTINAPLCAVLSGTNNITNGYSSTIIGSKNSTTNGYSSYIMGGDGFTTNAFAQVAMGNSPVIFTANQSPNLQTQQNILYSVGNSSNNSTHRSNAITTMASGMTLINHNDGISQTQDDVTPVAAFEVVSTTKGFLPPRLTSSEVTTWQSSFNTTTDVTGLAGAGNEKHSRQGEMVYNLTTSMYVSARWNGSAWNFVTF